MNEATRPRAPSVPKIPPATPAGVTVGVEDGALFGIGCADADGATGAEADTEAEAEGEAEEEGEGEADGFGAFPLRAPTTATRYAWLIEVS
jgi:hypothetical protein